MIPEKTLWKITSHCQPCQAHVEETLCKTLHGNDLVSKRFTGCETCSAGQEVNYGSHCASVIGDTVHSSVFMASEERKRGNLRYTLGGWRSAI
jgi:hypothetical protein